MLEHTRDLGAQKRGAESWSSDLDISQLVPGVLAVVVLAPG